MRKKPSYLANLQKPVLGAKILLRRLKNKRIKLAIVSNSNSKQTAFLLKKFQLRKYFDLVIDDSFPLPEKPHFERINFVINKFGIKPKNAVLVEDNVSTIVSAKKHGVKTAGVLTGNAAKKALSKVKTDIVIDSVKDLIKVI